MQQKHKMTVNCRNPCVEHFQDDVKLWPWLEMTLEMYDLYNAEYEVSHI